MALESCKALVQTRLRQFRFGHSECFHSGGLILDPIQRVFLRHLPVSSLIQGPRTAMLRNQHIALSLRFRELLLQGAQCAFQIFHLPSLIRRLLMEVRRHGAIAQRTLQGRAG